jgi:hypothetical protein
MLMVIFGAGASYDSDARRPASRDELRHERLPLAAHLVDPAHRAVANQYPASMTVIDFVEEQLATESPDDLETILARFAARADNSLACRQQLVAFRFYLCELISERTASWLRATNGLTIYLSLLSQLSEWQERSKERIQLVTFNYDTLLEDAASRVIPDWTFTGFGDYVSRPDWGLLKLHGSTNWSRVASDTVSGQAEPNARRALAAANAAHTGELPYLWGNAIQADREGPDVFLPAIAVPMASKTTFECEALQVDAFQSTVGEIRRLLVCGWRAAEAHAVEILSQINPGFYLGIVSGGMLDITAVEGNLGDVRRKGKLVLAQTDGMSAFATNMRKQLEPLLVPW